MTEDEDIRVTRIRPVHSAPKNKAADVLSDLKEMFGGGGGGGKGRRGHSNGSGGGGSGEEPDSIKVGSFIVIGALLLWGVFSSFYTVDVSEEGVVTRLGKYHATSPSGFHLKLPFGIDRVDNIKSKRDLLLEFGFRTRDTSNSRTEYDKEQFQGESLMLTGDLNVADVEWTLQYRIADPWKYLFHAVDVERSIRDISMSIMRRVVGDRLVSDVLTTGRVEIADEATVLTQRVLDTLDMGIKVENVILQDANPPERVKPSFSEVNSAQQEQEQTINNAEREYNRVIPEARGKAKKLIADAQAYAVEAVNNAKGDAAQFEQVVTAYKLAPEVTRSRLYLETMETIFKKMERVTIVDDGVKGMLPIFGNQKMAKTAADLDIATTK